MDPAAAARSTIVVRVPGARFQRLAEEALAEIPRAFRRIFYNVGIAVRAVPGAEAGRWKGSKDLLGLYTGPTRAEMASPFSGTYLPARIVLYRRNLSARAADDGELKRLVRTTLRHELAHHYGLTDDDLRRKWPEGA